MSSLSDNVQISSGINCFSNSPGVVAKARPDRPVVRHIIKALQDQDTDKSKKLLYHVVLYDLGLLRIWETIAPKDVETNHHCSLDRQQSSLTKRGNVSGHPIPIPRNKFPIQKSSFLWWWWKVVPILLLTCFFNHWFEGIFSLSFGVFVDPHPLQQANEHGKPSQHIVLSDLNLPAIAIQGEIYGGCCKSWFHGCLLEPLPLALTPASAAVVLDPMCT